MLMLSDERSARPREAAGLSPATPEAGPACPCPEIRGGMVIANGSSQGRVDGHFQRALRGQCVCPVQPEVCGRAPPSRFKQ